MSGIPGRRAVSDQFVDVPVVVAAEVEPGLHLQEPAMEQSSSFSGVLEAGWRPPMVRCRQPRVQGREAQRCIVSDEHVGLYVPERGQVSLGDRLFGPDGTPQARWPMSTELAPPRAARVAPLASTVL